MNMNFLNKPPMNKLFGNGKSPETGPVNDNENIYDLDANPADIESAKAASYGVSKGMSYLVLGGFVTAEMLGAVNTATAAAPANISPEDFTKAKTVFVESMKTAPAENKMYEEALIQYAEHIPAKNVSEKAGVKEYSKSFKLGDGFVAIKYKDDKAVTIKVRETLPDTASAQAKDTRAKTFIDLYDGYNGAPMDGIIDHTEISRGQTTFGILDGVKHDAIKAMGSADFKRDSISAKVVLPMSDDMGHDQKIFSYIKNQEYFNQMMKAAGQGAEKGNLAIAQDMAKKALEKGTINSISTDQQAKLDAQAKQNQARFDKGIAETPTE